MSIAANLATAVRHQLDEQHRTQLFDALKEA